MPPAAVRPFGDLDTADILVVGHDPRLQRSDSEAEFAFFFELLTRPPKTRGDVQKKALALAVCRYVDWLAGRRVSQDRLYVTNLCNEFLVRQAKGVIYIPEAQAQRGVRAITEAVSRGRFQVILPMAEQTFYWLCRLGFVDQADERVEDFVRNAWPREDKAKAGIYVKTGKAPFVSVCGQRFHHAGVPVIPVLHVNRWQWPLPPRWQRYRPGMEHARATVRQALGI
jgi:hypothetical protein